MAVIGNVNLHLHPSNVLASKEVNGNVIHQLYFPDFDGSHTDNHAFVFGTDNDALLIANGAISSANTTIDVVFYNASYTEINRISNASADKGRCHAYYEFGSIANTTMTSKVVGASYLRIISTHTCTNGVDTIVGTSPYVPIYHVRAYGYMSGGAGWNTAPAKCGNIFGAPGSGNRMEAVKFFIDCPQINIQDIGIQYEIYQNESWTTATNGTVAGTPGCGYSIEKIKFTVLNSTGFDTVTVTGTANMNGTWGYYYAEGQTIGAPGQRMEGFLMKMLG